jgi:RNA polymerase sigma-70 factor (ECF subfamily)
MDNGASSYNRFLKGDKSGFSEIIEMYNKSLIFFVNGFVKNLSVSEDIAADTFLVLLKKKSVFKENYTFKTWLFKIAHNIAVDYIRKHSNAKNVDIDDMETELTDKVTPEEIIIIAERDKQLHEAMSTLHSEYNQILHLIYFENMSYEQAGKVLKKNKKQIKNLTHRAKSALKIALERKGFSYED